MASTQLEVPAAHNGPTSRKCVLILRSRSAVERFLDSYPTLPAEADDVIYREAADWDADRAVVDEATFKTALALGLPVMAAPDLQPDTAALAQITPEQARRLRVVPLVIRKGLLAVMMGNPADTKAVEELDFLSAHRVVQLVATAHGLREGIARNYDSRQDAAVARMLGLDPQAANSMASEHDVERLALQQPVVQIVDTLIAEAVARRASDIHLRPGEKGLDILYRIDDEVVPVRRFMSVLQPVVISRIKVMASMNLAEHRRPLDGRTTFSCPDGRKVDLRISVMPSVYGESMVVRLLDTDESLWNLDQLGLTPADRMQIESVMARSHGMFLTTGPTGCGKSTTLYAMLLELRKQRINILTIEDPVEFFIEDIQQMQVNLATNFTFANAMRSFLRHDPDVIMVGEIRDRETGAIAVESALTGHLVLSTLHTNTAATTITRLLDLGVESYLLRASLLAVMSQRLVRLTCTECAEPETPDDHIREMLGVATDEQFLIGRGCSHCEGLGVRKRRAVYELMVISPRIRDLIVPGADADSIHYTAIDEGMTPLTQAAVRMARAGLISLSEAWRVRAD